MSIEITTKCSEELAKYLTNKLSYTSELEKITFDFKLDQSSNLSWMVSSDADVINGAAVYQSQKINRVDYTQVKYLVGDSASIVTEMISKLGTEAELTGKLVDPIHISEVETIGCLRQAGYRISGEVCVIELIRLLSKCKPESQLTSIRYKRSNTFEYGRTLLELMCEHDTLTHNNWNKMLGKKVYPTHLKTSNVYKVKQSYLARAIAQNQNWYCYMLFESDRAIGFIRAKVDKANHLSYPELYLRPGYFEKYSSAAYYLMLSTLHKSWVRYIGINSLKTFSEMDETIRKFGRPIGVNMFKM